MSWPGATTRTLFLLTCLSLVVSEVQRLDITPDQGTTFNISSTPSTGSECKVCTVSGRTRQCHTYQLFKNNAPISVELECLKRLGAFRVEVTRSIECTTKSCSGDIHIDSNFDTLLNLNRKFIWDLKAAFPAAAKINFGLTGLRQIKPSESCPDKHTYTFEVIQESSTDTVGRYCRTGSITNAQALRSSRFSLELPAGQRLQNIIFDVSIGEDIKSLAKISLSLPEGVSSLELFPPNYPDSFPDDDLMEWYFVVPTKHKASIQIFNLTQPRCLKKETAVEYHRLARAAQVVRLTEDQPVQNEGGFSMTLRNCEMDRSRTGYPGLSLNFKVSASKITSSVLCEVNLKKRPGLSLHIKKLNPLSHCIMKLKSVSKDQITLPPSSVSQVSFEACLPEEVQVTAITNLECNQAKTCPSPSMSIPTLPPCLSASLSNMTWSLTLSSDGTVELSFPSGPLRQELPGQPCNDSISIKMAESDGTTIGSFCRNGTITKVQMNTNVSISVCGKNVNQMSRILKASIKEKISEKFIFSVAPKKNTPLLLATPGWPKGMKSDYTVSWLISVPPKMEAHLMFANLNQPTCRTGHTFISIKSIGSHKEIYSLREDEKQEREITVSENFYLNMSNCMPKRGDFGVVTKITLQKSQLLTVIVSIVAVLLVIFVVVLVVVCLVIRKKKQNLNHQVSIYNPNGTSFLPGHNGFPRSRQDNESHVYDYIDDTLVYSHLLRNGAQTGIYNEFDTYRPIAGHTDSQRPLVATQSSEDNMEEGIYQEILHQQKPELPKRPPSHMQPVVDKSEEQSEDEQSPALESRLEPEGGELEPEGGELEPEGGELTQ